MPTGIIINCISVVLGGLLGALCGHRLTADFKTKLNMVFGVCAMSMGISSIVLMANMPAVIFAAVIGTAAGLYLRFGEVIERAASAAEHKVSALLPSGHHSEASASAQNFNQELITALVLFCASGTGIYGSIVSGMSGDHSILIAKSVLDLFTALIFGCSLGLIVSFIALPQLIIFLLLFFAGRFIYPLTTPEMINDFKAVGGILLLATGFRMIQVKMFPTVDMIPAMVLVMPVSWFWTTVLMPLL